MSCSLTKVGRLFELIFVKPPPLKSFVAILYGNTCINLTSERPFAPYLVFKSVSPPHALIKLQHFSLYSNTNVAHNYFRQSAEVILRKLMSVIHHMGVTWMGLADKDSRGTTL